MTSVRYSGFIYHYHWHFTFSRKTLTLPFLTPADTVDDKEGTSQDDDDDANGNNNDDDDIEGDELQAGSPEGEFDDDDDDDDDDENDDPLAFLRWRRRPAAFIFLVPNSIVKTDSGTHIRTDPSYNMEPLKKPKSEDNATMSMEPVVLKETIIRRPSLAMSDKIPVPSKSAKSRKGVGKRKKYGAL